MNGSRAHMPITQANPFVGGQFGQPHGATRMKFLRADGHFRPQPELPAIVEAGTGIHKHRRGVDLVDEMGGVVPIVGENGVRMFGAVFVDVVNGFVQPGNDLDAENEGQPLLIEVVGASGQDGSPVSAVLQEGEGGFGGAQFDMMLGQTRGRER